MNVRNTLETELNALTSQGKILEAREQFYFSDATFQEGNDPLKPGKLARHDFLLGSFATLKAFRCHITCTDNQRQPNYQRIDIRHAWPRRTDPVALDASHWVKSALTSALLSRLTETTTR